MKIPRNLCNDCIHDKGCSKLVKSTILKPHIGVVLCKHYQNEELTKILNSKKSN